MSQRIKTKGCLEIELLMGKDNLSCLAKGQIMHNLFEAKEIWGAIWCNILIQEYDKCHNKKCQILAEIATFTVKVGAPETLAEKWESLEDFSLCNKWKRTLCFLPTSIVFQLDKHWKKSKFFVVKPTRNMTQQCKLLISLLAEIKLIEKDGTQRTSVKIIVSKTLIVPMWVTEANWPFGNLTHLETIEVILVKYEIEQIIW
jgi:hypothetical protein